MFTCKLQHSMFAIQNLHKIRIFRSSNLILNFEGYIIINKSVRSRSNLHLKIRESMKSKLKLPQIFFIFIHYHYVK